MRGLKDSPILKPTVMAPPIRFRGIPRRSRVLVYALLCICIISLLQRFDFGIGRTLLFFLVSPEFAGRYEGGGGGGVDILQYVDPLIGTTNGGKITSVLSSYHRLTPLRARLPWRISPLRHGKSCSRHPIPSRKCSRLRLRLQPSPRILPHARFRNRRPAFARKLPSFRPSRLSRRRL